MSSSDKDLPQSLLMACVLRRLGYFVELKVPLFVPSYVEKYRRIPASDVDVLGIRFDSAFSHELAVAECKSGGHEGLDEVLKLQGVRDLLEARRAYFIKARVHANAREVARKLDIVCFEAHRLSEYAARLGIDVDRDLELERRYVADRGDMEGKLSKDGAALTYAAGEFWSREYWENIHNLIYLARPVVGESTPPLTQHLQFMVIRLASLLCISVLTMCSAVLNSGIDDISRAVEVFLFGGPQARRQRERLLDELRKAVPRAKALPPGVNPPFTPLLTELAARLVLSPDQARATPTVFGSLLRCVVSADWATVTEAKYDEVTLKLTKDVCEFLLASVGLTKPAAYLPEVFGL